jgi:hypothetical protein
VLFSADSWVGVSLEWKVPLGAVVDVLPDDEFEGVVVVVWAVAELGPKRATPMAPPANTEPSMATATRPFRTGFM